MKREMYYYYAQYLVSKYYNSILMACGVLVYVCIDSVNSLRVLDSVVLLIS